MAAKKKVNISVPPQQVALLVMLLMVIVGALFYFLVYKAKEEELKQLNVQLTMQTSRIAELEDTRQNLLKVEQRATKLTARLETLKAKLPADQEELNEFLSAISQRAQNARVTKWLLFDQHATEAAGEVSRVPIEMQFLASYDAATAFFWELSTMGEGVRSGGKEQVVNVTNVSFERRDEDPKGLLFVTCMAETYLYQGAASPEQQGASSKRGRRGRRGGRR